MRNYLEVLPTKGAKKGKKNDWFWRAKCSNDPDNDVYVSTGFDDKSTAMSAARNHNKKLIKPLPIIDVETGKVYQPK